MSKITKAHTFVKYTGANVLNIAGLQWLQYVLRIWSPSPTGSTMQSFGVAAGGGTLTQFIPDHDGYWIHSGSTLGWDLPSYLVKEAETNTVPVTPPSDTTYNTTLQPGGESNGVSFAGAEGTQFKFNTPLPSGDLDPKTMLIFAGVTTNPDNQIGHVDFNASAIGSPFGFTINDATYNKAFTEGNINILA